MAANGDNNDNGSEGQWSFDSLMVTDDFDEVVDLLHNPDCLYSLPPAASMQNVSAGNPLDWTAMPGNGAYSSVDTIAPPAAGTAMAGPSTSAHQDVDTSSSYVHQGALDCSGCQLLREIVHSNGLESTKLCIHGTAGLFYHATLDVYQVNNDGLDLAPAHRSFIDFTGRDYAWMRHYLMDYGKQRAAGGYTVVHDSISAFHDVLCTSIARVGVLTDDRGEVAPAEAENIVDDQQVLPNAGDAVQPMIEQEDIMPAASAPSQPNNANEPEQQDVRSRHKIQREKTSKLKLRDISRYFHLTIVDASKELGVGATFLKSICRKFGIKRWPHRLIKKIDTQIAKLRENGNGSALAMDKIQKLNDSRRIIIRDDP